MKTGIMCLFLIAALSLGSGCASFLSYQASQEEITRERVYASGDKKAIGMMERGIQPRAAIRAVQLDNGGVGVGVDVSSPEVLAKHPWRQLGAAILDAGMAYGVSKGIEALTDDGGDDESDSHPENSRDVNVTVKGEGNNTTVNVQGDSQDNSSGTE